MIQKNSDLGQQLYNIKQRVSKGEDGAGVIASDEDKIDKIEKDQMV